MTELPEPEKQVVEGANPLIQHIARILRATPQGLSEYDLIKALQTGPDACLNGQVFATDMDLFEAHFLVFNALYQLQTLWLDNGHGYLDILATHIQVLPNNQSLPDAPEQATLRSYYLNLNNLADTSAQDLADMLSHFWQRVMRHGTTLPDGKAVADAVNVLDVTWPCELTELKRTFRQRMHQCHPDKGGDTRSAQHLQHAFEVLISAHKNQP